MSFVTAGFGRWERLAVAGGLLVAAGFVISIFISIPGEAQPRKGGWDCFPNCGSPQEPPPRPPRPKG
jgi:hypothetical protein